MAYAKKSEKTPKAVSYPKQCWATQNETHTLSLENSLDIPTAEGNNCFYSMYGKFGAFKLFLITKGNGKQTCSYNFRGTDEVAYFLEQYEEAKIQRREFFRNGGEVSDSDSTPAYTVVFKTGNKLKGKTPAQFLLEGGSPDELKSQIPFLEKNLDKYPANQDVIDAIDDALYLHSTDQLSDKKVVSSSFVLLDEKNKYGYDEKKDLRVTCVFGDRYPWKFDFVNTKLEGGKTLLPDTVKSGTFVLSDEQMAGMISAMRENRAAFQSTIYPMMRSAALHVDARNHGQDYDPVAKLVDQLLDRIRPELIESVKAIVDTYDATKERK